MNAKYWRVLTRTMRDAAIWVVFGLTTVLTASVPVLAQINPAAFAGLEFSVTPATVIAVGQADPPPLVEIATTSSVTNPDAVFRRTSASAAWGLLSIAFAVLGVFNLVIFRHLRRTYAPKGHPKKAKTGLSAARGAGRY